MRADLVHSTLCGRRLTFLISSCVDDCCKVLPEIIDFGAKLLEDATVRRKVAPA